MIIHNCDQRSDEWHSIRLGKVTGTRFKDMMTAKKPGFETLCRKIAAEQITGKSADQPFNISAAMEQGIERESEARSVFEVEHLVEVQEVGFIEKEDDPMFGVSPDGLVYQEPSEPYAGLELKCPLIHTHLGYLLESEALFNTYKWQVFGALWVSGLDKWYLCSYCPEFEESKRLVEVEVVLGNSYREQIEEKAIQLKNRVEEILEAWRG